MKTASYCFCIILIISYYYIFSHLIKMAAKIHVFLKYHNVFLKKLLLQTENHLLITNIRIVFLSLQIMYYRYEYPYY